MILADGRTMEANYGERGQKEGVVKFVTSRGNAYEGEWDPMQRPPPTLDEMKEKLGAINAKKGNEIRRPLLPLSCYF